MLNWQNEKNVSAKNASTQKKKPFVWMKNGICAKKIYVNFRLEAPRTCEQQGVKNISFSENLS